MRLLIIVLIVGALLAMPAAAQFGPTPPPTLTPLPTWINPRPPAPLPTPTVAPTPIRTYLPAWSIDGEHKYTNH